MKQDISKVNVGDLWVWEKPSLVVGVSDDSIDLYVPEGTQDYFHSEQVLDNQTIRVKKHYFQSSMRDYGYYFK